MAEISGKRKAREMNDSNASEHDEPELKAKKTNDHRRRSSFARGKFAYGSRISDMSQINQINQLKQIDYHSQNH